MKAKFLQNMKEEISAGLTEARHGLCGISIDVYDVVGINVLAEIMITQGLHANHG